jgi:predicted nuclease of predicted toxin-antitoxin system
VRFLVDTQLPPVLARWLVERGHHAEHVLDVDLAQSTDSVLWNHAAVHGAVIITKDEDFAEWIARGRPGPSVVWLRVGNTSTRALISWLEPRLPWIIRSLTTGERLIEVR